MKQQYPENAISIDFVCVKKSGKPCRFCPSDPCPHAAKSTSEIKPSHYEENEVLVCTDVHARTFAMLEKIENLIGKRPVLMETGGVVG